MKPSENKSEERTASEAYLSDQNALVRLGGYWNCLNAAQELSALLFAEGRSPWIARLRDAENVNGQTVHLPLVPQGLGMVLAWTTHYICGCDGMAYDPVAGKPTHLAAYSLEVFGKQIAAEVFVRAGGLPAYLASDRLRR